MLQYDISGNGPEDLVLLHGLMENNSIWSDMEPYLSEKFRLIKIDLPGHGKSAISAEVHTTELMAEKVKEVTDSLKLGKFHLLGHSMGGYTALAFAEKNPQLLKSITLFFSTYFPDSEEKKQTRKKSFRIIEEEYSKYVNAGVPMLFSSDERDILEGKIELAKKIAFATPNQGALAAVKGIMVRPDRRKILEEFDGKILLLNGRHDNAVDYSITLKHLPDRSNLKSYLIDCGHNGHWEKPEICSAIINTELLHNLPKHLVL